MTFLNVIFREMTSILFQDYTTLKNEKGYLKKYRGSSHWCSEKYIFRNLIRTYLLLERTVLNYQSTEIQNSICENRIGLQIFCKNFGHRIRHQFFQNTYRQNILVATCSNKIMIFCKI